MLANFHTHTTYCDGKNTPEEVVQSAIRMGFTAIGFSGHGNTPFDLRYCMTDTEGYIREVNRLKACYGKEIQIYLGIEEDGFSMVDRNRFDYLIGSLHYVYLQGAYFPVDSGREFIETCLSRCGGDPCRVAESYFHTFIRYIKKRKPDIIGHFDLITKYDEAGEPIFMGNSDYEKMAEYFLSDAAQSGCLFEVNTGAMARGLRTTPYPHERLLRLLKRLDANVILSSDSHSAETLNFGFEEAKNLLRDVGFDGVYTLNAGKFVKVPL